MRLLQVLGYGEISSHVALKQTLKCNFYFEITWQNRILALGYLKKGQYLMALDIAQLAYTAWNTEVLASFLIANLIIIINWVRNPLTIKCGS